MVTIVLSKAVGAFKVWALQRSSVALKGSKSFLGKLKPFKMCFGLKLLASYGNFQKLKTHFFHFHLVTTALSQALEAFKVLASIQSLGF